MANGLRCLILLLFAESLVAPVALGMALRSCGLIESQRTGVAVLLAENAFPPTRVTASSQRALPPFEKKVVGSIRANDKILRSVVGSVVVDVVDFFGVFQVATKRPLCHENVLEHVPMIVRVRMPRSSLQDVSVAIANQSALPIGVFSKVHTNYMAPANEQGIAFPNTPTPAIPSPFSDWRGESATALTKARRIHQSRAPKVCADNALNLTHSGGFRG